MTIQAQTVRRTDRARVALLELDYPGRTMNVVDERVLEDFAVHVEGVLADEAIDAFVLSSAKGTFGAGADVGWLPELAKREDAEEFLAGVHRFMLSLAASSKPMVAAVNGAAYGGALELALGARALVVSTGTRMGLPEVTLGLLPGGGGTQLLTRFVSVETAADMLTSGRPLDAERAHEVGLAHSVVPQTDLLDAAITLAQRLAAGEGPAVGSPGGSTDAIGERREVLAGARGGLSQAAATILDVLEVGVAKGVEAGLAAERAGFLALLRSPAARAAIHLFQAETEVKRRSRGGGDPVERVAVVGGGQMGSGIAATAVTRGVPAVVRDLSEESLARSRAYLDKVLVRKGADPASVGDRWRGTTEWEGFAEAGAAVEAVFELPDLKKDLLAALSAVVSPTALIATNTSAISIAELATAVSGPERFIGMHFFSPVDRMPLVELIPHNGTSPETAQRAAALGGLLGKTPITVGDAPGFFTSRVYARWLMEGIRLLLDGVRPADIDAAARTVGFPVGPMQAHDEATIELVLQASIGQVAINVMTERLDVGGIQAALEKLVAAGVRSRRHGLGFYRYDDDGRRQGPNDAVLEILGVTPTDLPQDLVGERLLLAFSTECFLCWDDGTLCHPDDGDVGSILGIGFPRTLGGPFHWADEVGAATVAERCHTLGVREFPPGRTLLAMTSNGGTFAAQPRRPKPFADLPGDGDA